MNYWAVVKFKSDKILNCKCASELSELAQATESLSGRVGQSAKSLWSQDSGMLSPFLPFLLSFSAPLFFPLPFLTSSLYSSFSLPPCSLCSVSAYPFSSSPSPHPIPCLACEMGAGWSLCRLPPSLDMPWLPSGGTLLLVGPVRYATRAHPKWHASMMWPPDPTRPPSFLFCTDFPAGFLASTLVCTHHSIYPEVNWTHWFGGCLDSFLLFAETEGWPCK